VPVRPRARDASTRRGAGAESRPELVVVGRALVRERLQPVEVGVGADGRIVRVGRDVRGERREDWGDAILLPSATDIHAHFRSAVERPGADETVASGTLQAALGGVGLVGDMPNTSPPIDSVERLEERRAAARGRLAVDLFAYAALVRRRRVPALAREAAAFKLYLSPTTGIEPPPATEPIPGLLIAAAEAGLAVSVHAEDPAAFRPVARIENAEGWNAHRPVEAEVRGAERLRSPPPALRLHVAHVTAAEVADRLAELGIPSFEATPHHLLLSTGVRPTDPRGKVNPPLRPEPVRAALWERFRSGRIPLLASDHAPHSREEKARPYAEAPSGMPGVETMLPLLLARVRSADLDLAALARAACDRPARWIGAPQGRIAPGHRANLLVVDFRARTRLEARRLHAPVEWTAFEDFEAIFPRVHYLDGERIVEDGEYVGRSQGGYRRPEYAPGAPPAEDAESEAETPVAAPRVPSR
jgi:dihydroorotase